MSLKNKFLIEVAALLIFFSLIPLIWQQFYFNPLRENYVSSIDQFVLTIVEMPNKTTIVNDSVAYDTNNPPAETVQKLIFKSNLDEIRYKWMVDNKPIELTVDPNFGPIGDDPLEFRIQLNGSNRGKTIDGQYSYKADKFPLRILKDQRAVSVVNSFDTQSKMEVETFELQPDGLRDIQVAFTDKKDHFGVISWVFDQGKLPFKIGDKAKKVDVMGNKSFTLIFIPYSLEQLLYITANEGITPYTIYFVRNVLFPFLIISLLTYLISEKIFKKNNLFKVNLLFLILTVIIYPISNLITFYLFILYFLLSGQN